MRKQVREACRLLWDHRRLLYQTTRSDILARFAGSALGTLWLFLYPLLFLGCYTVIYLFVFKVKLGMFNSTEYVALIFCGLIPFLGFSEAIALGLPSIVSNANLIKNTIFPIELIPVKAVFAAQPTQVVGTGFLLMTLAYLGRLTAWALLLPVVWALQMMFSIGLIWFLATLNVYLRDLQNIVSVIILMLMMLSPIAYTADMVPSNLRLILYVNPLYYLIIAYQDCLMVGRFPRGPVFPVLLTMAVGSFAFGYWFMSATKRVFADNV